MARDAAPLPGVLIVEAQVLARHALADYLRHCGYGVIEAASTDEALVVLEEPAVRIDAVLCDAQAPGAVNPFRLRHLARAMGHRAGLQFILAGRVEAAAEAAADLCEEGPQLARPYDPQAVVTRIRRLIGRTLPPGADEDKR